ncbi:MAG: hypothetical protein IJ466_00715 [Clostridia bacterium]|nr:hypothetical protein [Clostridia bacterium]
MKIDVKGMLLKGWNWARNAVRRFWKVLSRRFWMKLLSLLLAILLWNYVVTSNRLITRTKTLNGLSGYVTSQSTLTTYGLALKEDPAELIDDVSVRLEVSQADFSAASADNVQVTLDLSKVRTAGTQEVPLKATTSYGKVVSIYPDAVALTFETLDSRAIPVNAVIGGEKEEDYWYDIVRTNPSTITVSGAASTVRSITQARVSTDVTGAEESYVRAEPYVLLDSSGQEVSQAMLTRSSTSITVMADVYPTKELPVSTAIEDVISGHPAEGYTVSGVSVQPESITVAAEQELLDDISELLIEPVSVEGLSQSFTARAKISLLSDFENASAEQVYVNITISEKNISEWIENAQISFVGKGENLQLEWQKNPVRVYVTGPRSQVEAMKAEGIAITVDLTGLGAGTHSCELRFPADRYPGVTFEPETPSISVSLTEAAAE